MEDIALVVAAIATISILGGLAIARVIRNADAAEQTGDDIADADNPYLSDEVRAFLNGSEGFPATAHPGGDTGGTLPLHPRAARLFGSPIHASLSGTTGARDNVR